MDYLTVKEAANKWGVSERRVQYYCSNNRIPGAKSIGKQWLIPEGAQQPADGRTKGGKDAVVSEPYHFPVLVHTRHYSNQTELCEGEIQLLNAQKFYLEGRYIDCIRLCRTLTKTTELSFVRFGAYATIAYASIVLALYTEYIHSLDILKSLRDSEEEHKEDFDFIIQAIEMHTSLTNINLDGIEIEKLSYDALPTYFVIFLTSMVTSGEAISEKMFKIQRLFNHAALSMGMLPTYLATNSLLATLSFRSGYQEDVEARLDASVSVAYKNEWLPYLVKYSIFELHSAVAGRVSAISDEAIERFKSVFDMTITSVHLFRSALNNDGDFKKYEAKDMQVMLLLTHHISDEGIYTALDLGEDVFNEQIKSLMERSGCSTREDLIGFALKLFETYGKR